MQESFPDRLKKAMSELGFSNYKLSKASKVSQSTIGRWIKGVSTPQEAQLSVVSDILEVTSEWLLTNGSDLSLNEIRRFKKNSIKKPLEPDAIWVEYNRFKKIPIVNKRAQAGFLSGWGDDEYVEELPTLLWEVDQEYKGKYIAFEVTGDSMDDNTRESIVEGDTLICREIQRQHWVNKLHLHRWKNFVVVHREEGILVKRVLEHDTTTGRLLLHSLNPLFDDQEVYMDDLIAIFNVIDIHRSL